MVIGKTLHSIIENAFALKEIEVVHPRLGVACTIDILEECTPIEFKTSRKRIKSSNQIPQSYIEQLQIYMTALQTRCGYLAILNVIDADLKLFRLDMSEMDCAEALEKFRKRKQALEQALEQDNPALLPKLEWQCRTCEYRSKCNGQTSSFASLFTAWNPST